MGRVAKTGAEVGVGVRSGVGAQKGTSKVRRELVLLLKAPGRVLVSSLLLKSIGGKL